MLQLPPHFVESLTDDWRDRLAAARVPLPDADSRGDLEIGLTATYLETPGGRAGLLFTFQDVTAIKKLERDAAMQQRLAAVGEMAAGIAHEIRNPLASMSGSIQILRQELPLSAEQEQLMDIVLRESERLNTTIRSFLAYARPQRFAITRFDVRRALNDAALLLRNSAEVCEAHLIEVDVPPQEVWYEADEGQIKQIVWNLATNGLRAMPSGGRLRLAAAVDPATGRRRPERAGRWDRHSARGARRALSTLSRPLRQRQRTWPRHRPSHRDGLQRRDSGQLAARPRHDRLGAPAGAARRSTA